MPLSDLYREVILDHTQHPRNRGHLEGADISIGLNNPTCGDEIVLELKLEGGEVSDARFSGHGCSISMSAASILTSMIKGKPGGDALRLAEAFKRMLRQESVDVDLGELQALEGVQKFPMRVKCATLAVNALEKGLTEWNQKGGASDGQG